MTTHLAKLYNNIKEHTANFFEQVTGDPFGYLVLPIGKLALIVLFGLMMIRLSNLLVDRIFSIRVMDTNRANTLHALIKSILNYTIYTLFVLVILLELGFDLMPIFAGAGILGLAIGFGAQNLVKDFITGFFLIFERQLEVGDTVQINGQIKGVVEEVGLRTTKIREHTQRLHYIPNGRIIQVTNYNRDRMRSIVHITVPYESNLNQINSILEDVCIDIQKTQGHILIEDPHVSGITNITTHGIQFTITALTYPEHYPSLENEIRKNIILHLQKNDIPFAYPQNPLHNPEV